MKLPLSITIMGWFFIAAGTVGFIYHISELDLSDPFKNDAAWVLFVRLLAIAGGVLILRGLEIGRWLLILWMAYHVVLSYFHAISELIMHSILLAVILYILLHPKVSEYFRSRRNRHAH